ncbi:hypothetical protein LUZ61_003934 [Rhynchospora tenuis]|uniref:Fucosyltransferase n=1 Tax=Rhynchospora tenuis TaxID=198213 RepID=A0AAD5ZM83_9POAL|nr:hypothetical protein LUZ61_003934 [Rhynchospora tenuis]
MANERKTLPYRELERDDDSPTRRHKEKKDEKNWGVPGAVLIVCLMTLPLLVFLCSGGRLSSKLIWLGDVKVNVVKGWEQGSNQTSSTPSNNNHTNGLIDGLISSNFDRESCLSRYESALYYKTIPHMPSSYLLQKLRNYEDLHKKCGPNTPLYKKSIEQLKSGHSVELMDCNYVVWIPFLGLGNRILTLVSTFLYAILTNRVMLIQATDDMVDLFCEPFPDTSWILPPDFPINNIMQLDVNSDVTYRNMLNKHVISNDPLVALLRIKPIFLMMVNDKIPDPPCTRAVSMEPCNLTPLLNTCTGNSTVDKEKFEQHVKQCEDVGQGIKLFD